MSARRNHQSKLRRHAAAPRRRSAVARNTKARSRPGSISLPRCRPTRRVEIAPGGRAMIPTGIAIALPPGSEGQVRPRSGLAARHGITVLNTPGTIDADYRGEIQVILVNLGSERFLVSRGMRIAQLVIARRSARQTDRIGEVWNATERGARRHGLHAEQCRRSRAAATDPALPFMIWTLSARFLLRVE